MKAIVTRSIGPTNTKPRRLVATADGGHRYVMSEPLDTIDDETPHTMAAHALAAPLGWLNPDSLITGRLPNGDTVHVLDSGIIRALRDLLRLFETGEHYETRNPYSRPEVKAALVALARVTGQSPHEWMNANRRASTLPDPESDDDAIAEWVGLHYGLHWPSLTKAKRAEFRGRYRELHDGADK